MIERLAAVQEAALVAVREANDEDGLERVRRAHLGQRGELTAILRGVGALPREDRSGVGQAANEVKRVIQAAVAARLEAIRRSHLAGIEESERIDVTFPGATLERGHPHVLIETQRELERVFEGLGYGVELGPEVETEWFNFEALNMARGHAARDAHDSFYFDDDTLLRTHNSPVEIRSMQRLREPPIRMVCPGRCYRRDAVDAYHLPYFIQLEGLAVDRGLTVADLKGTLLYFAQAMFGADRRIRMAPDYFPFTEPSYQVAVSCGICGGAGCRTCGQTGWLEILGCGMVHPQVLRNGGIDPERFTGFAWGMGVERIAMLRHDIDDIRLFYENDLRFLWQFG
ncbi:MAG: phenylalanine--tRNA ligase subunit alpha [Candidatus Dormibacteraceae bacterium]